MYEIHDRNVLQELTPWLRRTGWMTRFDGKNMKILHDLIAEPKRVPENPEDRLRLVWESVSRVMSNCWEGVKDCVSRDWNLILHWLASASKTEQSQSPFSVYMDKKTRARYTSYWQQFMVFVLRGLDDPERYGIDYTGKQQAILREIKNEIEKEDMLEDVLDDMVFEASLLFVQHSNFVKQRSALLYFTGILGYHVGWKRWRDPGDYTTMLAGLQWVMRILVLEFAIPTEERDEWFDIHQKNPLQQFLLSHKYLIEGEAFPYDRIHTLMNYGMKSSINRVKRSKVSWSTDEKILYYEGRPLRMRDWKRFVHEVLEEAEKMLAKRLLFREDETLPSVNLHSWIDNQSNRQTGYYFAKEEQNGVKKAQERMMKALRQSAEWGRMMENTGDDLMFNQAGVENYEHWDVRFRRTLLLLLTITCGLSGRGTEMTALKYMNTVVGDRHLALQDGQFMAITEYHKSLAIMDVLKA